MWKKIVLDLLKIVETLSEHKRRTKHVVQAIRINKMAVQYSLRSQ